MSSRRSPPNFEEAALIELVHNVVSTITFNSLAVIMIPTMSA
jgi:hypothetical protein